MGSKQEFAVVEFDDDSIEIIPYLWLCDESKKCYWPNKKNRNFQLLVTKNQPVRDPSNYTKWDVTILKASSSYEKCQLYINKLQKGDPNPELSEVELNGKRNQILIPPDADISDPDSTFNSTELNEEQSGSSQITQVEIIQPNGKLFIGQDSQSVSPFRPDLVVSANLTVPELHNTESTILTSIEFKKFTCEFNEFQKLKNLELEQIEIKKLDNDQSKYISVPLCNSIQ